MVKPKECLILLDAFQNIECLGSGKVDIPKINSEETRNLVDQYDDTDLLFFTTKIKIIAITDGPFTYLSLTRSLLFEKIKGDEYRLFNPKLENIMDDVDIDDSPCSIASSLPDATEETEIWAHFFYSDGEVYIREVNKAFVNGKRFEHPRMVLI
jgi:hypothetical protein